jgi:hypothetical protein
VGDADGDGDAVDQHELVAPVELVGLPRIEAQWHVGLRGRHRALPPPGPGIAADRVVAAGVTGRAHLLEDADQRQLLARRLGRVGGQLAVEQVPPRGDLRLGLGGPGVAELGGVGADDLADHLPRQAELPADRLDRHLLNEVGAPDLRDRLHHQHPNPGPHDVHGGQCGPMPTGSRLEADHPESGVLNPRLFTGGSGNGGSSLPRNRCVVAETAVRTGRPTFSRARPVTAPGRAPGRAAAPTFPRARDRSRPAGVQLDGAQDAPTFPRARATGHGRWARYAPGAELRRRGFPRCS